MPQPVPIDVQVNFSGISYDNQTGQWTIPSSAPVWTVKDTEVAHGKNILTWTLKPLNVPNGFSAQFDTDAGIVFKAKWPGGKPTASSTDGTVTCTDNFRKGHGDRTYSYSIFVDLVDSSGRVLQPFKLDPDIKNKGANRKHKHPKKKRKGANKKQKGANKTRQ